MSSSSVYSSPRILKALGLQKWSSAALLSLKDVWEEMNGIRLRCPLTRKENRESETEEKMERKGVREAPCIVHTTPRGADATWWTSFGLPPGIQSQWRLSLTNTLPTSLPAHWQSHNYLCLLTVLSRTHKHMLFSPSACCMHMNKLKASYPTFFW